MASQQTTWLYRGEHFDLSLPTRAQKTALQPASVSTALLAGTGLGASRPELGTDAITAASYPAALANQAAIGSICLLLGGAAISRVGPQHQPNNQKDAADAHRSKDPVGVGRPGHSSRLAEVLIGSRAV